MVTHGGMGQVSGWGRGVVAWQPLKVPEAPRVCSEVWRLQPFLPFLSFSPFPQAETSAPGCASSWCRGRIYPGLPCTHTPHTRYYTHHMTIPPHSMSLSTCTNTSSHKMRTVMCAEKGSGALGSDPKARAVTPDGVAREGFPQRDTQGMKEQPTGWREQP